MTTVRTKEELKTAQQAGALEIIVIGELAGKLKKAKKIALLGSVGLGVLATTLGVATFTAPVTGGLSYFVAAPVAVLTGVEIAAIIAASAMGIALVLAVFKGYDEVSFEPGKMVLKKKS